GRRPVKVATSSAQPSRSRGKAMTTSKVLGAHSPSAAAHSAPEDPQAPSMLPLCPDLSAATKGAYPSVFSTRRIRSSKRRGVCAMVGCGVMHFSPLHYRRLRFAKREAGTLPNPGGSVGRVFEAHQRSAGPRRLDPPYSSTSQYQSSSL